MAKLFAAIFVVLFLSACAVDPSTIIRTPRTAEPIGQIPNGEDNDATNQTGTPNQTEESPDLPPEITNAVENPNQVAAVEIDLTNFKERLLGLDGEEITALLGKPKFERNEPPARIWQYQSSVCFVDLFLFSEETDLTVDHVEVRGKQIEKVDEKSCFASILQAANGGEAAPAPALQPAPGAVKVAPVTQQPTINEESEEIAPPILIPEEPEIPAFGAPQTPNSTSEPEVPAFGAEETPNKSSDEEIDVPAFGPEESPSETPEEKIDVPAFGSNEPNPPSPAQQQPETTADEEEDEPEVEFILSPAPDEVPQKAPETPQSNAPEPTQPNRTPIQEDESEEPPELDLTPQPSVAPESKNAITPPAPKNENNDVPQEQSEEKPDEKESNDNTPNRPEIKENDGNESIDNLSSESDENESTENNSATEDNLDDSAINQQSGQQILLPNAPKIGAIKETDDLLGTPSP